MDDDRQRSRQRTLQADANKTQSNCADDGRVKSVSETERAVMKRQRLIHSIAIVLGVLVFATDVMTPVNVAVAVLYVVVVLLVASVASQLLTVAAAWTCVSLTVLGFLLAQSDQTSPASLARCVVSVLAIITVSALALRNQSSKGTLQKQIDLLNLTHDAIVACDLDGRIAFWSQGAQRLYGWHETEVLGKDIHELTQTDAALPIAELMKGALESSGWKGELTRRARDGRSVVVSSRWNVSRDKWGQPVAILSTDSDITQAKSLDSELRHQKEELASIVDAIPAMVWSASDAGRLFYRNQRWTDCGVDVGDGGTAWRDILHPEDFDAFEIEWRNALATGASFEVSARVQLISGEYRYMIIGAAPLRDAAGRILRWYGVNTDIEERRRAELALEKSRAELAHVTRITMLGELAASIAHEVTQPLAAIVTAGEAGLRWLNREVPDLEEVRYGIEQMTHDARRATEIIRQIRSMAKRRDPDAVVLDLNAVVEQSVGLVRRELQSHSIEVSQSYATALPVRGDRVQLQQVIINLLMNAIQAMSNVASSERRLVVSTQLLDDCMAQVSIEDSGHGIPDEHAASLFAPFFTTKKEGMGMGLSICRSIVETHRGRIWALSHEGRGALMQFVLPLQEEADK
ncbi:PAS domain-containing sensor histidine kinase [Paraburkholderia unamae]|uniref:histidine kinase n=1 Tax=Paraburkholderia unamae TaxID=219649 RepID=A0ABX5KNN3_9BURK|nr:PAS domain-containing sensor histidine kinase [Paraburkholderia unamae]PVX83662.1 PAS domain S-box-containing protein [Paraburkholderia unamae]RAR63809.1 PAS domain S-box-containing protein [Paraburkholderia unamae]